MNGSYLGYIHQSIRFHLFIERIGFVVGKQVVFRVVTSENSTISVLGLVNWTESFRSIV